MSTRMWLPELQTCKDMRSVFSSLVWKSQESIKNTDVKLDCLFVVSTPFFTIFLDCIKSRTPENGIELSDLPDLVCFSLFPTDFSNCYHQTKNPKTTTPFHDAQVWSLLLLKLILLPFSIGLWRLRTNQSNP